MEYTTLGRTGLKVSVAGLGCGGASRLGLARGKSQAEAVSLVRAAIDEGINLLDTATAYGTEGAVGEAIQGYDRDSLVVCTKHQLSPLGKPDLYPLQMVLDGLDNSLRLLGTDHVDVFYLHAITQGGRYDYAMDTVLPALMREREKGKFRYLGITEAPSQEIRHETLIRAVATNLFDVVMVAFALFHQNARETLFPLTLKHRVGTTIMFAVRDIFAHPDHLKRVVARLAEEGKVPAELAERDNPLDFLIREGGAASTMDAAYRFCRHEPGADVVLFGTSDIAHMKANVKSILAPPLPAADMAKVNEWFAPLVGEGLETPTR